MFLNGRRPTARLKNCGALAAVLLAGAFVPRPASAIEQFVPLPLATVPAGSTARAVAVAGPNAYWVAGAVRGAAGSPQASVWRVASDASDPSGNVVFALPLPTAPGAAAVATGIALRDGDPARPVVVGYVPAADGTPRGIVWTLEGNSIVANPLESGTEPSSVAHGAGVTGIAGRCRQPDGLWRACVWRGSGGPFERIDLGPAGSADSTALDIAVDVDGAGFVVAGAAQSAGGRLAAILVRIRGDVVVSTILETPSGADSVARAVEVASQRVVLVGEVSRAGRSRGVAWLETDGGTAPVLRAVPLPNGFEHSSLNGVLPGGPGSDLLLAVGTAWNLPEATSAFGAILAAGREPHAFAVAQLRGRTETVDKDETITIHADRNRFGSALAGDLAMPASGLVQAALLPPYVVDDATIETPDAVAVTVGAVPGPDRADAVARLWQADDTTLRVSPRGTAPELRIVIEFTSAGFTSPRAGAPGHVTLRGRIEPRHARSPTTADLLLQLQEAESGAWVEVGQLTVGTAFAAQTLVVDDPGRFAVAGGGPIRGRLVVLAGGERPTLELDQLTIGRIALQ